MRSARRSWSSTLTRLGFRRKPNRRRADRRHRHSQLEALEARQLLSVSPLSDSPYDNMTSVVVAPVQTTPVNVLLDPFSSFRRSRVNM